MILRMFHICVNFFRKIFTQLGKHTRSSYQLSLEDDDEDVSDHDDELSLLDEEL